MKQNQGAESGKLQGDVIKREKEFEGLHKTRVELSEIEERCEMKVRKLQRRDKEG